MRDDPTATWEELAREEPYFPLLRHDGSLEVASSRAASAAFLATGEADIELLLSAIGSLLGHELVLTSALDFGCGVGRLTIPLARRAAGVVACDAAPTMLDHALRNGELAGLANIARLDSDALGASTSRFDFVCSLCVMQYIPPLMGCRIIRTLLEHLLPAGVAALQIAFRPQERTLGDFARFFSRRRRAASSVDESPEVDRPLPASRTFRYSERAVSRAIASAGAHLIGRFPVGPDATDAVLVIQRG